MCLGFQNNHSLSIFNAQCLPMALSTRELPRGFTTTAIRLYFAIQWRVVRKFKPGFKIEGICLNWSKRLKEFKCRAHQWYITKSCWYYVYYSENKSFCKVWVKADWLIRELTVLFEQHFLCGIGAVAITIESPPPGVALYIYNVTGDPLHSRALAHSRAPLLTQPCPPLFTQPCHGRTISTAVCIYVAGLCASCPAV